ncbi:hypothetical protein R1sor_007992 [Riccia sorocarpa]|uniref:Uncharacterized protein n=1 Tax=Riccia sorocarpa TaxID=122646 RepID=A0ABD3HU96_9MARC
MRQLTLLSGSIRCLSIQTLGKNVGEFTQAERRWWLEEKNADVDGLEGISSWEDIRALWIENMDKLRVGVYEPYAYNWDRTYTK